MKNPKWHRDEIILGLNLYFQLSPGQIHARNPEIIELSKVLNKLPIYIDRPDAGKFRNPNGVGLKLSNFLAIDPNYAGSGMAAFSKLDFEIFHEFVNNRDLLGQIATQIRKVVDDVNLREQLARETALKEDIPFEVAEGQVLFKLHRYRERDVSIVKKKKQVMLAKHGQLSCEVCGFDFKAFYGEYGLGFIECHHKTPLHQSTLLRKTKLDDLALVCANCHRMLHWKVGVISIESLKKELRMKF